MHDTTNVKIFYIHSIYFDQHIFFIFKMEPNFMPWRIPLLNAIHFVRIRCFFHFRGRFLFSFFIPPLFRQRVKWKSRRKTLFHWISVRTFCQIFENSYPLLIKFAQLSSWQSCCRSRCCCHAPKMRRSRQCQQQTKRVNGAKGVLANGTRCVPVRFCTLNMPKKF